MFNSIYDFIFWLSALLLVVALCFMWGGRISNGENRYNTKYCMELSLDKDITFEECMEILEKGESK